MEVVWFLLIGLCAGWLAGHLTQRRGFGLAGNLIIGVIGAILGGFIFELIGFRSHSLIASLVTAVVGSLVLLALLGVVQRMPRR
jgi:uncharacterized membrane protein YeaQ/YmgE (transglycosylase-associated protein family)